MKEVASVRLYAWLTAYGAIAALVVESAISIFFAETELVNVADGSTIVLPTTGGMMQLPFVK